MDSTGATTAPHAALRTPTPGMVGTAILRILVAAACALALAWLLVPHATAVVWATRITPDHMLEPKSVALLAALRWVMPAAGLLGLGWMLAPPHWSAALQRAVTRATAARAALPVVLALACAVRLIWLLAYPTVPYADSEWYVRAATQLAQGSGYVWDVETGRPLVGWPVGLPALLAALFVVTGPQPAVGLGLNLVVGVLLVAQTCWIGERLFNRSTGVLAALLLALSPGVVVYTSLVNTDLLFAWLAALAFWLAVRQPARAAGNAAPARAIGSAVWVGVINGTGALVRATGLALLPFWILLRWTVARDLRALLRWGAVAAVGTLLVVLPWTARNYARFGTLIPVATNGGANFWIGNNPHAHGAFMWPHDPALNPLYPLIEQRDEVAVEREGYRLGRDWLRATLAADPQRVVTLYRAKLFYFWNAFDFGFGWNRLSAAQSGQPGAGTAAVVLANLVWLGTLAFALLGLVALALQGRRAALVQWSGFAFVLYWLALHMPFFGQDRFLMPALPFLALYAATGALALLSLARRAPSPALAPAAPPAPGAHTALDPTP